jgi:hypothetical protein
MVFEINLALLRRYDNSWSTTQITLDGADYVGANEDEPFDFLHVSLGQLTDMAREAWLCEVGRAPWYGHAPIAGLTIVGIEVLPDPDLYAESAELEEMQVHMDSLLPPALVNPVDPLPAVSPQVKDLPFTEPARQDACPRCGRAFCVHNDGGSCVDDQALADEYEDATALADLLQRHDAVWLAENASRCYTLDGDAMAEVWSSLAAHLREGRPIVISYACDWCADENGTHLCPECGGRLCANCLDTHECGELKELLSGGGEFDG